MDYPERSEDLATRGIKAVTCCPSGHHGSLRTHEIKPDGEVTPSYVCPEPTCGWHEWVRLEGWSLTGDA